ncbi:MAG: hypothetical protein ACP5KE_07560 [Candidatus Methanodesulfokora sp.]
MLEEIEAAKEGEIWLIKWDRDPASLLLRIDELKMNLIVKFLLKRICDSIKFSLELKRAA